MFLREDVIVIFCLFFLLPGFESRTLGAMQALAQLRSLKTTSPAEIRKVLTGAVPGVSYPTWSRIPKTSFTCDQVPQPGYYADVEAGCQLFNQITLICDWFYAVDCSKSEAFYSYSNPRLYHYSGHFLDDELTTPSYGDFFHSSDDEVGGQLEDAASSHVHNKALDDQSTSTTPTPLTTLTTRTTSASSKTTTVQVPDEDNNIYQPNQNPDHLWSDTDQIAGFRIMPPSTTTERPSIKISQIRNSTLDHLMPLLQLLQLILANESFVVMPGDLSLKQPADNGIQIGSTNPVKLPSFAKSEEDLGYFRNNFRSMPIAKNVTGQNSTYSSTVSELPLTLFSRTFRVLRPFHGTIDKNDRDQ